MPAVYSRVGCRLVSGTLARAYGSNLLSLNLCLLYSQAIRFSVRLKQEVLSNLAGSDPLPVSNRIFRIPGASRNLPAGFAAMPFSTCWFPVTDLTLRPLGLASLCRIPGGVSHHSGCGRKSLRRFHAGLSADRTPPRARFATHSVRPEW